MNAISGIVLAGGKSRRMGTDKAFLEVGGIPTVQRVLNALESLSDDLIIVTNDPERYEGLPGRLVSDVYPGKGALGGIYSGLLAARHDYTIVVACDMPFLNPRLLRYLVSLAAGYDVVVPDSGNGHLETTHAVYARTCLDPIKQLLLADQLKIIKLFPAVRVRYVGRDELLKIDPRLLSLLNMNTLADWQKVQQLAGEPGQLTDLAG
jgi:molybdopterin-guanine dinucleotide biosynthesis protein A